MRIIDTKQLSLFNTKMGMFICPSSKENVVSFIHGYELGAQGECKFTEIVKEHLEQKYKIKYGSLGWPDQLERLANKRSITWMETYLMISFEIINHSFNNERIDA